MWVTSQWPATVHDLRRLLCANTEKHLELAIENLGNAGIEVLASHLAGDSVVTALLLEECGLDDFGMCACAWYRAPLKRYCNNVIPTAFQCDSPQSRQILKEP